MSSKRKSGKETPEKEELKEKKLKIDDDVDSDGYKFHIKPHDLLSPKILKRQVEYRREIDRELGEKQKPILINYRILYDDKCKVQLRGILHTCHLTNEQISFLKKSKNDEYYILNENKIGYDDVYYDNGVEESNEDFLETIRFCTMWFNFSMPSEISEYGFTACITLTELVSETWKFDEWNQ